MHTFQVLVDFAIPRIVLCFYEIIRQPLALGLPASPLQLHHPRFRAITLPISITKPQLLASRKFHSAFVALCSEGSIILICIQNYLFQYHHYLHLSSLFTGSIIQCLTLVIYYSIDCSYRNSQLYCLKIPALSRHSGEIIILITVLFHSSL